MLVHVMVIETMTFRLIDSADAAEFVAVDKRVQSDFAYRQPGLVRRTTACRLGQVPGEWIVIDLWRSPEDADGGAARWDDDPVAEQFMAFVDRTSLEIRRYADLE